MLQLVKCILMNPKRIYYDAVIVKLNKIKPSETGCILILMATLYLQVFPFDHIREVRDLIFSEWKILELFHQAN